MKKVTADDLVYFLYFLYISPTVWVWNKDFFLGGSKRRDMVKTHPFALKMLQVLSAFL